MGKKGTAKCCTLDRIDLKSKRKVSLLYGLMGAGLLAMLVGALSFIWSFTEDQGNISIRFFVTGVVLVFAWLGLISAFDSEVI
jgi:hypothetical protein